MAKRVIKVTELEQWVKVADHITSDSEMVPFIV
jgi:hypothetical protein